MQCADETHSVPLAVEVDGANRYDMKQGMATLSEVMVPGRAPMPGKPQGLYLDKGYDYEEVRELMADLDYSVRLCSRGRLSNLTLTRLATAPGIEWTSAHTAG